MPGWINGPPPTWASSGTKVYKVFCFSVLQFYLQFYPVTGEVRQLEGRVRNNIFKGPGNWISREDISALHSQLGAPFSLPCADEVSVAARSSHLQGDRKAVAGTRWP